MTPAELLKHKVKGRTCFVLAQGKSLYELEKRINEFKNLDICWVGIGQFDNVEQNILHPVDMQLDVVFDCASVADSKSENYEKNHRIPRLSAFLKQTNEKLWITTHGIYRDSILRFKLDDFWNSYKNQTLLIDSLVPRDEIAKYMHVPNSLSLAIYSLVLGGANQIVIFGCDGYQGEVSIGIQSYYRPENVERERIAALGSLEDPGINRDTKDFEKRFKECFMLYANHANNFPDIYNCSNITIYEHIRKISYDEALMVAKNEKLEIERGEGWHLI